MESNKQDFGCRSWKCETVLSQSASPRSGLFLSKKKSSSLLVIVILTQHPNQWQTLVCAPHPGARCPSARTEASSSLSSQNSLQNNGPNKNSKSLYKHHLKVLIDCCPQDLQFRPYGPWSGNQKKDNHMWFWLARTNVAEHKLFIASTLVHALSRSLPSTPNQCG